MAKHKRHNQNGPDLWTVRNRARHRELNGGESHNIFDSGHAARLFREKHVDDPRYKDCYKAAFNKEGPIIIELDFPLDSHHWYSDPLERADPYLLGLYFSDRNLIKAQDADDFLKIAMFLNHFNASSRAITTYYDEPAFTLNEMFIGESKRLWLEIYMKGITKIRQHKKQSAQAAPKHAQRRRYGEEYADTRQNLNEIMEGELGRARAITIIPTKYAFEHKRTPRYLSFNCNSQYIVDARFPNGKGYLLTHKLVFPREKHLEEYANKLRDEFLSCSRRTLIARPFIPNIQQEIVDNAEIGQHYMEWYVVGRAQFTRQALAEDVIYMLPPRHKGFDFKKVKREYGASVPRTGEQRSLEYSD